MKSPTEKTNLWSQQLPSRGHPSVGWSQELLTRLHVLRQRLVPRTSVVQADGVLRRMAIALEQLAAAEAQPRCARQKRGILEYLVTVEAVDFFLGKDISRCCWLLLTFFFWGERIFRGSKHSDESLVFPVSALFNSFVPGVFLKGLDKGTDEKQRKNWEGEEVKASLYCKCRDWSLDVCFFYFMFDDCICQICYNLPESRNIYSRHAIDRDW